MAPLEAYWLTAELGSAPTFLAHFVAGSGIAGKRDVGVERTSEVGVVPTGLQELHLAGGDLRCSNRFGGNRFVEAKLKATT